MSRVDLDVIRPRLARLDHAPTPAEVAEAMRAEGWPVTDAALMAAVGELRRDCDGAGPLEPLLRTPGVTDVLVNGADEVWCDRGAGLERTPLRFGSEAEVRRLATRLVAASGRRLDDSSPCADARLPDGTRVHAVLSVLADPGTCLSLRVPARSGLPLSEWEANGSLHPLGAAILRRMIETRLAFLVSGGTGTGKTTLLAALLGLVPASERLLVVEDSRELCPVHPHCVRLEARPPNAEGAGEVSLTHLVRQALRMRPDRVVLGEVRGGEICDLLTALNTGHEGGCGTVHANSARDVAARVEALAALGGMGREAAHAQAASALDLVVHIRRERDGRRRVSEVAVVTRRATSGSPEIEIVPAVSFGADGEVVPGPGRARLEELMSR